MASNTSHNSLPTVHTDSQSGEFVPLEIFVTNDQRRIAEIIIDLSFSFIVACVGIVTNILVVIVFSKQGFKDSVSVSMTIIACWDFFKCVAGVLQRLPGPMSLASAALAKSWSNISAIEFNYFLSFSTYVASVLAAYVSVERCLCVSMPFKVKELITPKVALFFGLLISAVVFGCFMVMFFVYDIVWIFSDHFNATIAVYVNNVFFSRNPGPLFQYYNLSGIVWPTSSLGIIAGSTAIIAYHLRKSSQFRLKSASAGQTWDSNIGQRSTYSCYIVIYVNLWKPHSCLMTFLYSFIFSRLHQAEVSKNTEIMIIANLLNFPYTPTPPLRPPYLSLDLPICCKNVSIS